MRGKEKKTNETNKIFVRNKIFLLLHNDFLHKGTHNFENLNKKKNNTA